MVRRNKVGKNTAGLTWYLYKAIQTIDKRGWWWKRRGVLVTNMDKGESEQGSRRKKTCVCVRVRVRKTAKRRIISEFEERGKEEAYADEVERRQ